MDEPRVQGSHELLLALAGRVDDDLLGWARELVAVGEDARAVELLTATLVADRAVLPDPVRTALVDAGRAARSDPDAELLPPSRPEDGTAHHFRADPGKGVRGDVAGALQGLGARQVEGCRLHLTWRLTPAGAAPGPLPHPVVLVEVEPGGRPSDVLAYQLAVALERVGVHPSVEVLVPGRPLCAYHSAALREARPVPTLGSEPGPVDDRPADGLPIGTDPSPPASLNSEDPQGAATDPGPDAGPPDAPPAVSDDTDRHPVVAPAGPQPAPDGEERRRDATLTPTFAAMRDPLTGPIGGPLMAPLLEPSAAGRDSWAGEWESDAWAMAPTALTEGGPPTPSEPADPGPETPSSGAGEPAPEPPNVPGRADVRHHPAGPAQVTPHPPRHRHPDEPGSDASAPVRRAAGSPSPVPRDRNPAPRPQPVQGHDGHAGPDLGLRPETLARLSTADRELLARLQGELGGSPRLSRTPGVTNGTRPGPAAPERARPHPEEDRTDPAG